MQKNKTLALTVVSVEEDVGLVYMQDSDFNTFVMDWNTQGAILSGMKVGMSFMCDVNSSGYVLLVHPQDF